MFLTRPSMAYKESYINALREFQMEGRNLQFDISEVEKDFEAFVNKLLDRAEESKLTLGRVPESIFWLIDKDEFIGRVSIRHRLNERLLECDGNIGYEIRPLVRRMGYGTNILKLGLIEAKKIGLEKALLTCSAANTGSKLIIEKNGGVFEGSAYVEKEKDTMLRYWIYII